jgi:uncharacterized protein YbjT (DUF2867 family)
MRIAVAGGTGVVGRYVVEAVRAAGHEPVGLARSTGVDVASGNGLDRALDGVSRLIDATNVTTMSRKAATAFFEAATGNLLAAERRAGVAHHVALSIVGVDRVGLGYYAAKLRQEELVLGSGGSGGPVPATVLRATQFHEFPGQMLQRIGRGPVALAPAMLSQPVAAREVGEHLVQLALGEPQGMVPELAGPEVLRMPDLMRRVLRASGSRKPVLTVSMPFGAARAAATGGLLPTLDGPRGRVTFDEWLTAETRAAVG